MFLIGTHVLVVVLDGKRCVSGCGVYLCIYCFRTEGSAEGEPLAIDHRGVFSHSRESVGEEH